MDEEDARLELCRRFLRWFGPQTVDHFRWWTGVEAKDAAITWGKLRRELALMEVAGESGMLLEADTDRVRSAEPLSGVRLIQNDDPWLKLVEGEGAGGGECVGPVDPGRQRQPPQVLDAAVCHAGCPTGGVVVGDRQVGLA